MRAIEETVRLYIAKRADKDVRKEESPYLMPDCEWSKREMKKPSVILKLLRDEYYDHAAVPRKRPL